MFYETIEDLPKGVRDVLPKHAQDIYKDAFNSAYIEYANPSRRRDPDESRIETASKVAWAAVKQTYARDENGSWHAKKG
jgi:cation transport regulator